MPAAGLDRRGRAADSRQTTVCVLLSLITLLGLGLYSSKLDSPGIGFLGRNDLGGTWPRLSWGQSVL
jgi:hypothetical protein